MFRLHQSVRTASVRPSSGRRSSSHRGFSLIELAVVVAIIGILAAIAIPTFLGQRQGAQDAAAQSSLRSIAMQARAIATGGAATAAGDTAILAAPSDLALADLLFARGTGEFPLNIIDVLTVADPAYDMVDGDTASTDPDEVSVGVPLEVAAGGAEDLTKVAYAALSESGTCWFVTDDLARGVRWGKDTSATAPENCNAGRVKLAADEAEFEDEFGGDDSAIHFDEITGASHNEIDNPIAAPGGGGEGGEEGEDPPFSGDVCERTEGVNLVPDPGFDNPASPSVVSSLVYLPNANWDPNYLEFNFLDPIWVFHQFFMYNTPWESKYVADNASVVDSGGAQGNVLEMSDQAWFRDEGEMEIAFGNMQQGFAFYLGACEIDGLLSPITTAVEPGDVVEISYLTQVLPAPPLPTANRWGQIGWIFFDEDGNPVGGGGDPMSTHEISPGPGWTAVSNTTTAAPAGAAFMAFQFQYTTNWAIPFAFDDLSIIVNP